MSNDKTMLLVKVDAKAVATLDRIGGMSNSNAAEAMRRLLDATQYMVSLVDEGKALDASTLQEELAKALISEAPDSSPEALQFVAGIWSRAAEFKKEGGNK